MMTSLSTPRFRLALAALFVGVVAITMLALLGVAHADPLPPGDPVVAAQAATDASWALVAQYGPLWGAFLLAFGIVGAWLKANESRHWIAQGRALAGITGVAMVLGAVADWHFHGAPVAGVIVTAVMAVKLVWQPTVAAAPAPSSEAKSAAGAVSLLMLVLLVGAGGAALTSCAPVRPVATTAVAAELDCTSAQIAATVNALAQPAKDYLLGKISGDGRTVDTAALRADARALKSQAWTCALSTAFALLLQPPAASAGFSARVEPGGPDPDVLRAAWAELRGELGVGRVVTSAGAI